MKQLLSLFVGSTALAAMVSQPATAQEYSSGCECKPCPVIITPVEAYGVHPPGADCCCKKGTVIPYYAPLSPTATCYRFREICLTPYYCGYCAKHYFWKHPKPLYGCDGGWGPGPMPEGPGTPPFNYGPFTSVLTDDTLFWRMGGNGLVSYGAPQPPRVGPPDLVDMIQASRPWSGGPPCVASAGPAILPPPETPAVKVGALDKEGKTAPPAGGPKLPD
jgi:hypothetical protein